MEETSTGWRAIKLRELHFVQNQLHYKKSIPEQVNLSDVMHVNSGRVKELMRILFTTGCSSSEKGQVL